MKDFLTNRSQPVKTNGVSTEPVNVTSAVAHGSVLGTHLFLTYINDIPYTIAAIMKVFADVAKTTKAFNSRERRKFARSSEYCRPVRNLGRHLGNVISSKIM